MDFNHQIDSIKIENSSIKALKKMMKYKKFSLLFCEKLNQNLQEKLSSKRMIIDVKSQ
jgi:hypothetical protein